MKTERIDKLSQDAAKAKAAGLSYGKWRALQPGKTTKAGNEIPEGMKQCPFCKKLFTPSNGTQKFCEPFCQKEAYRDKQRMMNAAYRRKKWEQQRLEKQKRKEQEDGK